MRILMAPVHADSAAAPGRPVTRTSGRARNAACRVRGDRRGRGRSFRPPGSTHRLVDFALNASAVATLEIDMRAKRCRLRRANENGARAFRHEHAIQGVKQTRFGDLDRAKRDRRLPDVRHDNHHHIAAKPNRKQPATRTANDPTSFHQNTPGNGQCGAAPQSHGPM